MAAIALPTQTTIQSSEGMLSDTGRRFFIGSLNLPASYNTGGYLIASSQFGMVGTTCIISGAFISGGHPLALVATSDDSFNSIKGFLVFDLSTGAEAAGGFDCSGAPCHVMIVGN